MNNRKHIIIKSNFDDADNELEKYQKEGYTLHGNIISNGDSVLITLRKEEIKEVKESGNESHNEVKKTTAKSKKKHEKEQLEINYPVQNKYSKKETDDQYSEIEKEIMNKYLSMGKIT